MKQHAIELSRQYETALTAHLRSGRQACGGPVARLGQRVMQAGWQTLELARLHEKIIVTELLACHTARAKASLIKRAGTFFASAITPIEKNHHSVKQVVEQQKKFIESLGRRTNELAAANMELSGEVARRKTAEKALRESEKHYVLLLAQSDNLQLQLRQLSRQILCAQEEERKQISRELHDVIAQTLAGINISLATLKKEATHNTNGIVKNIVQTQKMVEQSVEMVHRFARKLRPAVLDDLGLTPALHSLVRSFKEETGLKVRFRSFSGLEKLGATSRTVLYRIAQEALTNVSRHAQARHVEVTMRKSGRWVCLEVKDDGCSFAAAETMGSKSDKRLGLIGMRERAEMAGGTFSIDSTPGQGSTVRALVPFGVRRQRLRKNSRRGVKL